MSHALRLMHFNPMWQQEFLQTRSSLLQATEGWIVDCRHVGSTHLEGSFARPTIDVLAGISQLQGLNQAAEMIEGLGYRRLASPAWCDDELVAYLEKPRHGAPTHSVLLAHIESNTWRHTLDIQQQLASSLALQQELQNLKRDHYSSGCQAADNYAAAKAEFFARLSP